MGHAIKAEIRKLMTTRLWWGMAIAVFVIAAGIATLLGATSSTNPTAEAEAAGSPRMQPMELTITTYTGAASFGYVLLMVIGILTIGSEYRHQTITGSLLATPKRARLIGAKVVALLAFGVMYGVIFLIGSVAAGASVLSARGYDLFLGEGEVQRSLLLLLLVLGLWALIGLGIGILIPNQVAAMLFGVALAFIIEPIFGSVAASQDWGEAIAPYFPSQATGAILGSYSGDMDQLSWWAASLVMLAYAAVLAAVGTVLTQRRDVT